MLPGMSSGQQMEFQSVQLQIFRIGQILFRMEMEGLSSSGKIKEAVASLIFMHND